MNYQTVLDKAQELYTLMDALANDYLASHREDNAATLTHVKLAIQKLLGVPPLVIRPDPPAPVVERVEPPPPPPVELVAHEVISEPAPKPPARSHHRSK